MVGPETGIEPGPQPALLKTRKARSRSRAFFFADGSSGRRAFCWCLQRRLVRSGSRLWGAFGAFLGGLGGRFAYRARFRLAQAELQRGNIDRAAGMLEQNLQGLRGDPQVDTDEVVQAIVKSKYAEKRSRSTTAPEMSATVIAANIAWKIANTRCGIVAA